MTGPRPTANNWTYFSKKPTRPAPHARTTERATAQAQRINPDAGKPMGEEEKKILFGQGRA